MRLRIAQLLGGGHRPAAPDEHRSWRMLVLACLVLALALWAVLALEPPVVPGVQLGRPSPRDITADRTVTYVSEWRTEQERARAESSADTVVYRADPTVPVQQRTQLSDLLQTITQIRDDPTLGAAEERQRLLALPDSTLVIDEELAGQIARQNADQWALIRRLSLELYDRAQAEYSYVLNDAALARLRSHSLPYWAALEIDGTGRDLALLFSGSFLKANQFIDEAATQQRKQEVRDAVRPVTVRLLEGESVVRQGDVVTPDVQEKLEALGALRSAPSWQFIAGRGLLALLLAGMFGTYLAVAQRDVWSRPRALLTVVGLLVATALVARLTVPLGPAWSYGFPLALMAMLLAALFNVGLALLAAGLLGLVIALLGDGQLGTAMSLLLGSMAGAYFVGRGERSLAFMVGGAAVALITAATQSALFLSAGPTLALEGLLPILLLSVVNGILSALLALALYNLAGHAAGIVTPLRLMELAHPAQPLLRRLIREAPGTYYHSVAVGNLAESAAEAIGADALLLRVASYYHDIGKTVRPYFFTDNQSDRENVHDDLDPHTSAGIIADHVREGVRLAREAGLPRQIVDFIPTHHGTAVIKHFYQRALQQHDAVDEQDYRYPGPRPQTREQAIMMLADTVEATVRSKVQHGKVISARDSLGGNGRAAGDGQTIEELVTAIIDERVRSGQLDECQLTLAEIARIRQAFVATLQGIYHPRVDYTPGKQG